MGKCKYGHRLPCGDASPCVYCERDELRAEVESNKALLARWARVGVALTELLETWEQNNAPSSILPGETLADAHARELREALDTNPEAKR